MQCPVCHNEVGPQDAFCNHCGASVAAAAPGPVPPQTPPSPPPISAQVPPASNGYAVPPPVAASSGLSPNAASAIAYLTFIPAIIFLLMEPYNKIPLVRFHSLQSIGLSLVWFVLHVAASLLLTPFGFLMHAFLGGLISLGLFIAWLISIVKASQGQWFKLPIIGDFALKQAQS